MRRPAVVVFDVNETLLDLSALRPMFAEIVGDATMIGPWFSTTLRNSMVAALTHRYAPFPEQAIAALLSVAAAAGTPIEEDAARSVVAGMETLPAHHDAVPALERLAAAGFRLGTLSNSSPLMAQRQLEHAGLESWFEHRLSVEAVRTFKPDPAPYLHAAERFGVQIFDVCLVAAHDWDVTGAMRAGASGAFVARPGMVLGRLSETPDVAGGDLIQVADHIIAAAG